MTIPEQILMCLAGASLLAAVLGWRMRKDGNWHHGNFDRMFRWRPNGGWEYRAMTDEEQRNRQADEAW